MKLGTRGSPLALAQARTAADVLSRIGGVDVELVEITTTGDRVTDRSFQSIGTKGMFTGELHDALARGDIDAAVHSCKDLPADTHVAAVLERADARDVVVGTPLSSLPPGTIVGTSSLRRSALLGLRGLRAGPLRGNIGTRVDKVVRGEYPAAVLAGAGLQRGGLAEHIVEWLDPAEWLPAPAQGAIAIESDLEWVREADHGPTREAIDAEREFMGLMEGGCSIPLGALHRDGMLDGFIALPDGSRFLRAQATSPSALARELRAQGADDLLAQLRS